MSKMTNAEFTTDKNFQKAAIAVGNHFLGKVPTGEKDSDGNPTFRDNLTYITIRQASKFRLHKGIVWQNRHIADDENFTKVTE